MTTLSHKIDFAFIISVTKANPNGDPLNGNRPRQDYEGYGEISDVAIKRKLRNRLQDVGAAIFVQANDRKTDSFNSLRERADSNCDVKELIEGKKVDDTLLAVLACEQWLDVRSFGQVFSFKKSKDKGVSLGVRGPVSIHHATTVDRITITSMQITKSVNTEPEQKKGSDTMGMKHRVDFGLYVGYGSINPQLAEKTGFTDEDAEKIKQALSTLFENDASSARPEGSMEVVNVYWWRHPSKLGKYSSAKVHGLLKIKAKHDRPKSVADYTVTLDELEGLPVEVIDGR